MPPPDEEILRSAFRKCYVCMALDPLELLAERWFDSQRRRCRVHLLPQGDSCTPT